MFAHNDIHLIYVDRPKNNNRTSNNRQFRCIRALLVVLRSDQLICEWIENHRLSHNFIVPRFVVGVLLLLFSTNIFSFHLFTWLCPGARHHTAMLSNALNGFNCLCLALNLYMINIGLNFYEIIAQPLIVPCSVLSCGTLLANIFFSHIHLVHSVANIYNLIDVNVLFQIFDCVDVNVHSRHRLLFLNSKNTTTTTITACESVLVFVTCTQRKFANYLSQ